MILLIDTNVLLDVLQHRPGLHRDSSLVWDAIARRQAEGYVSMISFNNVFYVIRRQAGLVAALDAVRFVRQSFRCVPFDERLLDEALRLGAAGDLEDAIQLASATQSHADYLITRNVADFAKIGAVTAIAPDEFLALVKP